MYGYRMTANNQLEIVPEEAEVIRWIYDMYLNGNGGPAIADALNEAGIKNSKGLPWRANTILKIISNEKYMGDAMMGKSVSIDGRKCDNMDGQYGERYYIENAHEGIVSKETFHRAQEQRRRRQNPKLVKQEHPLYPFTGMIECGQCHCGYRHKVNNSGIKWRTDIWMCSQQERRGVTVCDCTRIKDSVLREKFVEAHNEFITLRPQGTVIEELQSKIAKLQKQEQELATLMLRKLIPKNAFRAEQKSIKSRIQETREKIKEYQQHCIRESDFTILTEFDETKIPLFIKRVIIAKNKVTFRFYNGVEITKEYTNGQPGNKVGWNRKEV